MMKLKVLTAATLLAITGHAGAASIGITDGTPDNLAENGNGEFFLTVWDEVRQVSYNRQFEMFVNEFVPSEKVGIQDGAGDATPEAGLARTFTGDALFSSAFGASNANDIKWHITAMDNRLISQTRSTPDALRALVTTPTIPPSNIASVSGLEGSTQAWDAYVNAVNSIGCGTGAGVSCSTTDITSPAFGSFLDTTNFQGLGATILGLNTSAFFQYVTGKAGSPALTKPDRLIYDNSVANGIWTLGADGTATYTLAPAVVPVPAAVWLFGSGLLGLAAVARRKVSA